MRRTPEGETLETVRIDNDAAALAGELAKAGEHPEVVLEATYGWAADVLAECGANVHLAHPLGNSWGNRRVKNERDATDLVDMLRLGRLAEAWIAPPSLRELRELIRYRAKLVHIRSGLKSQVHSVLAKEGVAVPMSDLFGVAGQVLLDSCGLAETFATRVQSLRDVIEVIDREITMLQGRIAPATGPSRPSPGSVRSWAIFVAEIGDVSRFPSARHLASWAGLTPPTASRTPRCAAGISPSRDHAWCAGLRSRP